MKYYISLDTKSTDKRVHALWTIAEKAGIEVCDWTQTRDGRRLVYVAPRTKYEGTGDYIFDYNLLSEDQEFVRENNYLTALAQKELLEQRFGNAKQKILLVGYGKLTEELEKVLTDADIHILQFNHSKIEEVNAKYGPKAYFETAPVHEFPVIINTVPKPVVKLHKPIPAVIYELASPPYGFDFGKLNMKKVDYLIEAGLPGRFYPERAAQAVFDCIMRRLAKKKSVVLCLTASPCSYGKIAPHLKALSEKYNIIPVMSENALKPNRFLDIEQFKAHLVELCGNNIITTITASETLSGKKEIVASAVVPATGNTIAKLANAVTDTPVTMAVKALLRNGKPCIMGISSNDALSGNAANIGTLLNRKNYYFVPLCQDDPVNKPFSLVCDFAKLPETIDTALEGKQIQPILIKTDSQRQ
jgi:dipicolinate synthase subunit B